MPVIPQLIKVSSAGEVSEFLCNEAGNLHAYIAQQAPNRFPPAYCISAFNLKALGDSASHSSTSGT